MDIKNITNPSITTIPNIGPTKTFEIKNVKERVLKLNISIGIIAIFAHKVTNNMFNIYFHTLFSTFIFFSILEYKNTIPIVPAKDN